MVSTAVSQISGTVSGTSLPCRDHTSQENASAHEVCPWATQIKLNK